MTIEESKNRKRHAQGNFNIMHRTQSNLNEAYRTRLLARLGNVDWLSPVLT